MRKSTKAIRGIFVLCNVLIIALIMGGVAFSAGINPAEQVRKILNETGVNGGLVVHLGCDDGRLTAALCANDAFVVQGLCWEQADTKEVRDYIQSQDIYGQVTVDYLRSDHLPYIDNLVNLIVAEETGNIAMDEIMRVLRPDGVAYIKQDSSWKKVVKPKPDEIDDWTHYLYDPSGNPVTHDTAVEPPKHMQWLGAPRWARHHDHMSSLSAMVSAKGRVFYIMDEGPLESIELPADWKVVARDAFNGKILWKRSIDKWHTHLWPLKSGPAQLPRRLVAKGDKVYVTLGIDAPVSVLDAASGKTLKTFEKTRGTEEILLSNGVLLLVVNPNPEQSEYESIKEIRRGYNAPYWEGEPRNIMAVNPENGAVIWKNESVILPNTLATDQKGVYFHNGDCIAAYDFESGEEQWQSDPIPRSEVIRSFFAPTLIVSEDVILFAGGERAGKQGGEWYTSGIDTMSAVSTQNGKILWQAEHPPSGYRSPEDILVVGGLVWTGETTSGRVLGLFRGRDLHTGEVRQEFIPDVDTYWFHHRCHRSRATDRFLLTSRTGIEFIDPKTEHWDINHWVRGSCLYGIMPANGMIYAPPHPCACYLDAKLFGFNALAPKRESMKIPDDESGQDRIEHGPAFGEIHSKESDSKESNPWPTYRQNVARSGSIPFQLSAQLNDKWKTSLGGKLTSPVIGYDKVFVASVDRHTLTALDTESGDSVWTYTTGGRIDSPPALYKGGVYFGCADGWVYCLRGRDGQLAWRFRAAPLERQMMAYEQLESVWPVHGNVLIHDDVLYCAAGRSMFLDGGVRLWRLNPHTGEVLSETVLDDQVEEEQKNHQDYVTWLNMPAALPDILSCDGEHIYMRSQPFTLEGKRLPLKKYPSTGNADRGAPPAEQNAEFAHLFSPTGFLDDTWWHRSYWLYGSTYISGWCGYYLAGKTAPAGRILVFDDESVYAFGRKPQYYRWTTPLEHLLYSAPKTPKSIEKPIRKGAKQKVQQIEHGWERSIPLLVKAMVKADNTLFIAGPPDLVDEEEVLIKLNDKGTVENLKKQQSALKGQMGSFLWAVSTADGETLAEYKMESMPVWDGMAAATGSLYISTTDGQVLCMSGDS